MTLTWNTKRPKNKIARIGEVFKYSGVLYTVVSVEGREVRMERVK